MVDPDRDELNWAAYALDGRVNFDYWRTERFSQVFAPGSVIVDVGCGNGWLLAEVVQRGCRGVGTEVYEELVQSARGRGCDAVCAPAEALPLQTASADGALFAGVLPFTEEDEAFAELARVLKPGARLEAYYVGVGFSLRDLLLGRTLRKRYFGARALINSVLMSLFRCKLPGKYGDTVHITHARVAALYARHSFALQTNTPAPTFLGLPVFIYHTAFRGR